MRTTPQIGPTTAPAIAAPEKLLLLDDTGLAVVVGKVVAVIEGDVDEIDEVAGDVSITIAVVVVVIIGIDVEAE